MTMRTTLLALTVACGLTAACESTAHTVIQPGAQPAGHPLRFGVIDRKPGAFRNPAYGFSIWVPDPMGVDSMSQVVFDGPAAKPNTHSWAFLQPPDPHEGKSAHWRRMVVTAVQGVPTTNQRVWTMIATDTRKSMLKRAPGAEVVENVVRWRADTAEYRIGVHDFAKEEFVNTRCLGSHMGRQRSVIVCVQTTAPTVEELAAVRESLVLTPPEIATADK